MNDRDQRQLTTPADISRSSGPTISIVEPVAAVPSASHGPRIVEAKEPPVDPPPATVSEEKKTKRSWWRRTFGS